MAYTNHGPVSGSRFVNTILDDGWRWRSGPASEPTEIFVHITSLKGGVAGVRSWERAAFWEAMAAWEQVADIDFRHSRFYSQSDIGLAVDDRRHFPDEVPRDTIAFQNGPYGARKAGGIAVGGYLRDNPAWTVAGTNPGGDAFATILHEFGHGLGLAHPFDQGPSGASPLGLRKFKASQLLTVMAYASPDLYWEGYTSFTDVARSDEWRPLDRGHPLTPSPLDIAAIQTLYGANLDQDDGDGDGSPDDTYWVPASNKAGVGWTTIWDTGGVDWIRHAGTRDVRISLDPFSPAKGVNQQVAGQAEWVRGGLMIAGDVTGALGEGQGVAGVVIENAAGGGGADRIAGNAAANVLHGGVGHDRLYGRGGDDLLRGGAGRDMLQGGLGDDQLYGDADADRLTGNDGDDQLFGGAGADELSGDKGADRLQGGTGDDRLSGGGGVDRFVFRDGDGRDVIVGFGADVIDLRRHDGVDDFDALIAASRQWRYDARLDLGDGDMIVLQGVKLAELTQDNFLF